MDPLVALLDLIAFDYKICYALDRRYELDIILKAFSLCVICFIYIFTQSEIVF